jgi:hypothetical protein
VVLSDSPSNNSRVSSENTKLLLFQFCVQRCEVGARNSSAVVLRHAWRSTAWCMLRPWPCVVVLVAEVLNTIGFLPREPHRIDLRCLVANRKYIYMVLRLTFVARWRNEVVTRALLSSLVNELGAMIALSFPKRLVSSLTDALSGKVVRESYVAVESYVVAPAEGTIWMHMKPIRCAGTK